LDFDNQTGDILVLVGGRDFEPTNMIARCKRSASRNRDAAVCYGAAFEKECSGSLVEDSPLDNRAVMIGGTPAFSVNGGRKAGRTVTKGAMTARQALAKSRMAATVRIGMDAGVDSVLQLCSAAGVRSSLRPYPATFLGSSEITIAELALA